MAIYLPDTSVMVDAMKGRRNRRELLADLLAAVQRPELLHDQCHRSLHGYAPS
jgi:hypothetical protein